MIADTSLQAFRELKDINHKQQTVLSCIYYNGPVCNYQIAELLDWEINRVTPRVNELNAMGKIELAYKDISPTGRKAKFWRIYKVLEQRRLL